MYILRLVIFFSFIGQSFLFSLTIDKAIVKIGNEYITNLDIYIAKNFYFYKLSLNEKEILDKLIFMKAAIMDSRNVGITINNGIIVKYQETLIRDYGGLKNLEKSLGFYDINFNVLRNYIRKYLLYRTIKENTLLKKVVVRFSEIRNYYDNIYLKNQEKYKLPVKTIAEMAPLIENKIRSEKASKMEKVWRKEILSHYKIEYLK